MELALKMLAGAGLLLIVQVLWPALRVYADRKAQNLADKEDIAELTKLVESVKHENQLLLEQLRGKHQLRMAAADRRLQAHQEAFTLWRELMAEAHTDKCPELVGKCQDWWNKNCIYLTSEARSAFNQAYSGAHSRWTYLKWQVRDAATLAAIQECFQAMRVAGDAIVQGAELPSLGPEKEAADVTADPPRSGSAAPPPSSGP